MNSCWSPVFWCNNGGTPLSHPPPSPNVYIASYLSILWIPVEFPYFNVTMVELCSLIPPLPHFTLHFFISVNFMNSCWSPVFWCNNGGTLLSHPPPPPSPIPPYIASYLSILWIPVEVPYFDVTMVELRSLIPPLPHFTLHCFISVNFMNSCWSPVFWCNNGGTLLSHPPPRPPIHHTLLHICQFYEFLLKSRILMLQWWNFALSLPPPLRPNLLHICVNFMNSCWSPVFWCNNGGTSLSHPPPLPQSTLHCFISVNFMNSCWSPVFWCNNGGTLLSHPPPPPPIHPTLLNICQFYEFLLKSVFWCNNGGTLLSHPPPLPHSTLYCSYLSIL